MFFFVISRRNRFESDTIIYQLLVWKSMWHYSNETWSGILVLCQSNDLNYSHQTLMVQRSTRCLIVLWALKGWTLIFRGQKNSFADVAWGLPTLFIDWIVHRGDISSRATTSLRDMKCYARATYSVEALFPLESTRIAGERMKAIKQWNL